MKKIFFLFIASVFVLTAAQDVAGVSKISVLAPAEDSFIGIHRILVIGKILNGASADRVYISENGKAAGSVPVHRGTFVFSSTLTDGFHEIVFSASGAEAKTVKVFMGSQEGYRYHIKTNGDSCGDCHAEASRHQYRISPMQTAVCSRCHKPLETFKYAHGPAAAGACTPCHDPHGSRHQKFLVATGKDLCVVCHDQKTSRNHVQNRENARCMECHDPHGSSRNHHLRLTY